MRKLLINPAAWIFALFVLAAALILSGCSTAEVNRADVKIMAGQGHGSGFHIGNGIVLTAAHVVGENKTVTIKSAKGDTQGGEVLWSSTKYDIAYIRVEKPSALGKANLVCRDPVPGELIEIRGNPGAIEFVSVWGRVAGDRREVGPWPSVVVMDITTVPGQSGGGRV